MVASSILMMNTWPVFIWYLISLFLFGDYASAIIDYTNIAERTYMFCSIVGIFLTMVAYIRSNFHFMLVLLNLLIRCQM